MATSTERFGFTLPSGQDPASVVPLNLNTQNIEKYLGMTQDMLAPLYDATEGTYEVDDIVTYDSVLYKCIEAVETPEAFDEIKWVQTTAVSEGGGGAGAIEKTQSEYDALTPAQKTNGAIYMVQGESSSAEPFDMTNIVKYIETNVDVTSSQDETTFTWDGGSLIGMTMYYTQKVDLTDVHTINYSLTTGTCYGGNPLRNFAVGVCETAPSAVTAHSNINYAVHNVYDDSDANSQFTSETLDVSELTGEYYIVVTGFGWNATLSNIVTIQGSEATNKIYYMGTEYANTNGGSGGGGEGYTETILWSGSETTNKWVEPIVLNNVNVDEYDALAIQVNVSQHIVSTEQIPVGDASASSVIGVNGFLNTNGENVVGIWLNKGNNLLRIFTATNVTIVVTKVVGIKYATGGGGESSYEETSLFSGQTASTGEGVTVNLSGNISDYDAIVIDCGRELEGDWRRGYLWYLTSDISIDQWLLQIINENDHTTAYWSYASDSSITWVSAYNAYPVTLFSIKGIKFGSGGSVNNYYASFIDTDNVIDSGTYTGTFTYTATEDCYVNVALVNNSNSNAQITIDGAIINYTWSTNGITNYQTLPLKKGQTLVATSSAGNALDYTVYGITYASGGSSSGSSGIDYSTDEQDTGIKWIDGSPIYQKTMVLTNLSLQQGSNNFELSTFNISDVQYVIEQPKGFLKVNASDIRTYPFGSAYSISTYATPTKLVIERTGNNLSLAELIVTIRYTKAVN